MRKTMNMQPSPDGGGSVIDELVTCRHCGNRGMVILDANGDGAPCPMCTLGDFHNVRWRLPYRSTQLVPSSLWPWPPGCDMTGVSWNHGLTVSHTAGCAGCGVRPALPGRECADCAGGAVWGEFIAKKKGRSVLSIAADVMQARAEAGDGCLEACRRCGVLPAVVDGWCVGCDEGMRRLEDGDV